MKIFGIVFIGLMVWIVFAFLSTEKTVQNTETAKINLDDTLTKVNQAESKRLDYMDSF